MDKYAGFSAVETIRKYDETDIMILHEAGTVGFACDEPPRKVLANAAGVTKQLAKDGHLYILSIPEDAGRAVISLS